MTRYALTDSGDLLAVWPTGTCDRAIPVWAASGGVDPEDLEVLAAQLTGLSRQIWHTYTHPASAANRLEADDDPNSERARRASTRAAVDRVVDTAAHPHLPMDDGMMTVSYDPVEEMAHRVGRCLVNAADESLTSAVLSELSVEVAALQTAELGDLSGRAAQGIAHPRPTASPVQVAAAQRMLELDLFGSIDLYRAIEPAAASVAAAEWLYAAAIVAGEACGLEPADAIRDADNIEAFPSETPAYVVEAMDVSESAVDIVEELIADAVSVADGRVPDLDALADERDEIDGRVWPGRSEEEQDLLRQMHRLEVRACRLDPRRPAVDLLEDLLAGIYGAYLIYDDAADMDYRSNGEEDDDAADEALERHRDEVREHFVAAVRAQMQT